MALTKAKPAHLPVNQGSIAHHNFMVHCPPVIVIVSFKLAQQTVCLKIRAEWHLKLGFLTKKNPPYPGGFGKVLAARGAVHPTRVSNSLVAAFGSRKRSFATLACMATRATSSTSFASA